MRLALPNTITGADLPAKGLNRPPTRPSLPRGEGLRQAEPIVPKCGALIKTVLLYDR